MRNFIFLLLFILFAGNAAANPMPDHLDAMVPDAKVVGAARLKVLMWEVYDATLYAPNGKWKKACPFALNLTYLRNLDGADIADRSVEEMRKQGFTDEIQLAAWHGEMRHIFPNVQKGTSLTGICNEQDETVFLENGKHIGTIRDTLFSQHFFDIWLGERTSEPALRKKLLGIL